MVAGIQVEVRGIVQGVGFRPFIYTLANHLNLTGWVRNTSNGVDIEVDGSPESLQAFLHAIEFNPPPLARIDQIQTRHQPAQGFTDFVILSSQPRPGDFIPISPDVSICPDCQRELFDPADRRYRYPFINCTNCGPRFTIIKDIPYDRPTTTMSGFPLCDPCRAEYENPLDRRFHAQPVACPTCGPQVWFESQGSRLADGEDALQTARQWLKEGRILAVKGLGGYHLACDATNAQAVNTLRQRKKRSDKPFALMVFDLASAEKYGEVSSADRALLLSPAHPIVLLDRRLDTPDAAPGQTTLGIMLAYTPLHLLLLEPAQGYPDILVMTSGNLSEEPIAYQDGDAQERLAGLADGFLLHNRPIHMRVDDSVIRTIEEKPYFLRRARGYSPDPLLLDTDLPPILATGAELKNAFCLTRDRYAFISHHIGDMENYETLQSFEQGIAHYERLFRIQPQMIACDLHPDYLATVYANERAENEDLPLVEVQHHHAHLAACLADNRWKSVEPVIGLSFDGAGMGTDGAIWGSEVLVGGYADYSRQFHLVYVPQPGGDMAVRKPARMALAYLWQNHLDWEADLPPMQALCYDERTALRAQLELRLNSPPTSSMGRLFDAVSALAGVRQEATYEGQAAMELESVADPDEIGAYPFNLLGGTIDPYPMLVELISDWRSGKPVSILSARFHNGLVSLVLDMCQQLRKSTGIQTVALSGGVWQNKRLLTRSIQVLRRDGFNVLVHHRTPANDGCIALGQALVAAFSNQ